MLKKRISAALIVKDDLVVQSFGFSFHLPIGKIVPSVRNLAKWQVDEIIILDISAASRGEVNLDLIRAASAASYGTPIVYGGGIQNSWEAAKIIQNGADRLIVGASFIEGNCSPKSIAKAVGAQAIILSLPLIETKDEVFVLNYISGRKSNVDEYKEYYNDLNVSEVLITDILAVGSNKKGFSLSDYCKEQFKDVSQILYGGIAATDITSLLSSEDVVSVVLGNILHHKELNYWSIKNSLTPSDDSFPRKINVL